MRHANLSCPHAGALVALDPDVCWFCERCVALRRPPCGMCGSVFAPEQIRDGFEGHRRTWVGGWKRLPNYCAACVARIRETPWKERRARSTAARSLELRRVFPELLEVKHTDSVTQLAGEVGGRRCQVRLRRGSRQRRGGERYVFHVELCSLRDPGVTALRTALTPVMSRLDTLAITVDDGCWLRAGFLHLGKLDVVQVLECLLAEAADRDGREGGPGQSPA